MNEEFLEQAKERARVAKEEKEEKYYLTSIEEAVSDVYLSDMDEDLLKKFLQHCNISDDLHSSSAINAFVQLGIFADIDGKITPTGIGDLLFGKNPQLKFPNALIRATIIRDGKEVVETFEGALVKQPEQIEKWIEDNLDSWISRKKAKREKICEYPMEAIREIVTNAILHRDYAIEGAPIYVEINDEAIVVKSPGLPVRPLTLEQIETFSAPSLSRNPKIIYVFDKFDLAEQRGLGFKTVRSLPKEHNIPLPKVTFDGINIVMTMPFEYRQDTRNDIDAALERGVDFAKTHQLFSKKEYAVGLSIAERTAERQLQQMTGLGIVVKEGSGPNTKYRYK